MSESPIALSTRVNPPVLGHQRGPHEVTIHLQLEVAGDADWHSPLDLMIAGVGMAGPIGEAVTQGIASVVGPDDKLRGIGRNGLVSDWTDAVAQPFGQIADALTEIRERGVGSRGLLILDNAAAEPLAPLVAAATALAESGRPFDVICTEPAVDLGLLTRLAALGGGELVSAPDLDAVVERARVWTKRLQTRALSDTRVEFEFASGVQPLQLFRVSPSPLFFGNVRLGGAEGRRLVIDPGVISRDAMPGFVLLAETPDAPAGHRKLADITFIARGDSGTLRHKVSAGYVYNGSTDTVTLADARVVALRDRVQGVALVEDVARAYTNGDARRVSGLLESLVHHYASMGMDEPTSHAYETRLRFLRTGILGRATLNRLRRVATG